MAAAARPTHTAACSLVEMTSARCCRRRRACVASDARLVLLLVLPASSCCTLAYRCRACIGKAVGSAGGVCLSWLE